MSFLTGIDDGNHVHITFSFSNPIYVIEKLKCGLVDVIWYFKTLTTMHISHFQFKLMLYSVKLRPPSPVITEREEFNIRYGSFFHCLALYFHVYSIYIIFLLVKYLLYTSKCPNHMSIIPIYSAILPVSTWAVFPKHDEQVKLSSISTVYFFHSLQDNSKWVVLTRVSINFNHPVTAYLQCKFVDSNHHAWAVILICLLPCFHNDMY